MQPAFTSHTVSTTNSLSLQPHSAANSLIDQASTGFICRALAGGAGQNSMGILSSLGSGVFQLPACLWCLTTHIKVSVESVIQCTVPGVCVVYKAAHVLNRGKCVGFKCGAHLF